MKAYPVQVALLVLATVAGVVVVVHFDWPTYAFGAVGLAVSAIYLAIPRAWRDK